MGRGRLFVTWAVLLVVSLATAGLFIQREGYRLTDRRVDALLLKLSDKVSKFRFKAAQMMTNSDGADRKGSWKTEKQEYNGSARRSIIVVVGGGSAGLTAALEASKACKESGKRCRVLVLEKQSKIGGNSIKASSGINALVPENPQDSFESFSSDTINSGGGVSDKELIKLLVDESEDAIRFLEKHGVVFASQPVQLGGHSHPRTYTVKTGAVGAAIIKSLEKAILEDENVEIITKASVERLMKRGDAVSGVLYMDGDGRSHEIDADAVVLTTGGFGGNKEWIHKYAPGLQHEYSTNGACAHGDGIVLGIEAGSTAIHMDRVQIHPTSFVDPNDPNSLTKVRECIEFGHYYTLFIN